MRAILIILILSAGTLFASEVMNVSVCNLGELPDLIVRRAEVEASAVFRSVDVQIEWKECGEGPVDKLAGVRRFTLRLRNDTPPFTVGASSLDFMGRAFVGEHGGGYLADAYFPPIQGLARQQEADADALLGYVIAHELGHLLLGPGHVAVGVMRAWWNVAELNALQRRWLRFNISEGTRIRHELCAGSGTTKLAISKGDAFQ